MAETPTDVLVAGYPDIDGATNDFESLGARPGQVGLDRRRDPGDARQTALSRCGRRAAISVARDWGGAARSGSR
jgi:hypothetical protein